MGQIYIPNVGEAFQMTLNGEDPTNNPIAMIRSDGYYDQWSYIGQKITGVVTAHFKLISAKNVWVVEIIEEIKQHGKIPSGQWRQAFTKQFPEWRSAYKYIGFPDCSWKNDENDTKLFPYLGKHGGSGLARSISSADSDWLWLVEISK
jgi:hypothetical protein